MVSYANLCGVCSCLCTYSNQPLIRQYTARQLTRSWIRDNVWLSQTYCLVFSFLCVCQSASLFCLPAGGAAGGGYAQVIPMEEVSDYRHPVSRYHKALSLSMPQLMKALEELTQTLRLSKRKCIVQKFETTSENSFLFYALFNWFFFIFYY